MMRNIHLFNPMWDATGGSEWRTISLFSLLAEHTDVDIWSEYMPDARLVGKYPIKEMLKLRSFPKSGTFVFVGCYFELGGWVKQTKPDRIVLIYNVEAPHQLRARLEQLSGLGAPVEVVYSSQALADRAQHPGIVEASPIDLTRFSFLERPEDRFVVGRYSRDVPDKFHPEELAFLASLPYQVRVLGGQTLKAQGELPPNLEITTPDIEPAEDFVSTIDCFYYRTHPDWFETYGRICVEAMASGLPCVMERRHGYRDLIEHGTTGYLFDTEDDARQILAHLASNPDERLAIGKRAAESIRHAYADQERKLLDFYLR